MKINLVLQCDQPDATKTSPSELGLVLLAMSFAGCRLALTPSICDSSKWLGIASLIPAHRATHD